MLKDILTDIVRHTYGIGCIDLVKMTGGDGKLTIETMDTDRNVCIKGELNKTIDELEGTVGLARMHVLDRNLRYGGFTDSGIGIKTQAKDGIVIPSEVSFSGGGTKSSYRFMSEVMVNDVLKIPPFRGVKWDVEVKPSLKSTQDLQYFAATLGKTEPLFAVSTENNSLIFSLGSSSSDRASVAVSNAVVGELKHAWKYPIAQVLAVLKLIEDGNSCVLSISDVGALQLELDSGIGTYKYIFGARR